MTLTGRAGALAAAGALIIAVFGTGVALLAVNATLVAAIVADLLLAASVGRLNLSRSAEGTIHLGQAGEATLTVSNAGTRRLRGLIRDGWRPSAGAAPGRARIALRPGDRTRVITTLTPQRRGDIAAGPVTVRSIGPLGLAARQRSLNAPCTVRVLPPFLSRKHLPEKLARLRELDGQHRSMLRGQGTEFDSLREYVVGDDVRSIDWRSTARRGDVLVRTWRPERDRRIVIVLDTGRTSAGRVGGLPRLDVSMDAALLLAALAVRAGDRVDLIAADRRVRTRVAGAGRGNVLGAFTSALALLEPDLVESDAGLMITAVLGTVRQRSLIVLLTDLNPAAIEEALLPKIRLLTSRHEVLLAAVADPRLAEMTADRADPAAIYGAAAAVVAQAARDRAGVLLRRHGVEVLDEPAGRLAPALADAYLSLKAAGRL
jgi:uncharacterized protein (DUF58 family)